jgi:regulator of sigma E protease
VAQQLGLQPGDTILSVNGVSMTQQIPADGQLQPQANALRDQTQKSIGKPIEIVVQRTTEGTTAPQQVTLAGEVPANANPNAPLGVSLSFNVTKSERMNVPFFEALRLAGQDVANVFVGIVRAPVDLIQQRIPAEQARPVGVVGITNIGVSLIEERTTQGLFPFIRFAGFLSIILGITNLLPIPALDGGRILFILIEILRGRRVDPQREQWVHAIGMMILLGLSAVIVVLDIINPISIR